MDAEIAAAAEATASNGRNKMSAGMAFSILLVPIVLILLGSFAPLFQDGDVEPAEESSNGVRNTGGLEDAAVGSARAGNQQHQFWAISRFFHIDVTDTIRGWTIGGFVAGVAILIFVCILSMFQGVLPGLM